MIDQDGEDAFRLLCDNCGDDADEIFESFQDAVDYKTNRSNKWASLKDSHGEWHDLCPSCNTMEVHMKLRNLKPKKVSDTPTQAELDMLQKLIDSVPEEEEDDD